MVLRTARPALPPPTMAIDFEGWDTCKSSCGHPLSIGEVKGAENERRERNACRMFIMAQQRFLGVSDNQETRTCSSWDGVQNRRLS